MTNTQQKPEDFIHKLNAINTEIYQLARNLDWDNVKILTTNRQLILEEYFSASCSDTIYYGKNTLLTIESSIKDSDNKIKAMIKDHKNSTIKSSTNLQKSYKAVNEYRATHNATTSS